MPRKSDRDGLVTGSSGLLGPGLRLLDPSFVLMMVVCGLAPVYLDLACCEKQKKKQILQARKPKLVL